LRKRLIAASLVLAVAGLATASGQEQARKPLYVPGETRVALLPVINRTGERWEELKQRQNDRGNSFLSEEFGKRGFNLISYDAIFRAMAKLEIDMSDEEYHRRETLYQLGEELQADLIMLVVITDTSQHYYEQMLGNRRQGIAKMKVWLLDVPRREAIYSAKQVSGESGGSVFAELDKGSARQVIAVANGLRGVLKDFLQPYPARRR
jgi:ABC-type phosphate/phosphonate transport system substrate-binding protein